MKNGTNPEYQYSIADHQGNTRVVFSGAPVIAQNSTASMEATSNGDFQNYPTGGSRNSLSIYNHTTGGTYSQLLNGGNNSQIGVAKSYKVYPGDKVKINAYAKYANPTSNSSNVSAFASALLNAFLLPAPIGGELGTASSALNSWGSVVAAGGDGQSNAAPHVSVNIIMFDKNYKFLDAAYDQIAATAQQAGVSPVVAHDYMTKEYTVKEEGYVFMYIANENATQVDAYFDDVAMTYTPTSVVQYNEYYAFGLQTSTSWTRTNTTNNFLYNEASELNTTTGLYDLPYRNYDAALGRFFQVDPLAHIDASTSPFAYAGNNPANFNDPWGLLTQAEFNSIVNYLWDSPYGGSWSVDAGGGGGGGNMTMFGSDAEAANWAMDNFGSLGATEQYAYAKLQGISTGSSWLHNRHQYNTSSRNGSNTNFTYVREGNKTQDNYVIFNSGNYLENYEETVEYMTLQAKKQGRLVAGLGLSDGTFVVLSTEGKAYKGRRRTKEYVVNGDSYDMIYTNLLPSKGNSDKFRVKVDGSWLGVNDYMISIPNVSNYYIQLGMERESREWILPFIGWEDKGREMGAENLILLYNRQLAGQSSEIFKLN